MTVLPHPKAPGIAVVPPCTQLSTYAFSRVFTFVRSLHSLTGTKNPGHAVQSTEDSLLIAFQRQVVENGRARVASWCILLFRLRIRLPTLYPVYTRQANE